MQKTPIRQQNQTRYGFTVLTAGFLSADKLLVP
jgi:hypothetical protein